MVFRRSQVLRVSEGMGSGASLCLDTVMCERYPQELVSHQSPAILDAERSLLPQNPYFFRGILLWPLTRCVTTVILPGFLSITVLPHSITPQQIIREEDSLFTGRGRMQTVSWPPITHPCFLGWGIALEEGKLG